MTVVLLAAGAWSLLHRRRPAPEPEWSDEETRAWTMPPLALLGRPESSAGRKAAMLGLRAYLVVAVLLLGVKAIQLGGG